MTTVELSPPRRRAVGAIRSPRFAIEALLGLAAAVPTWIAMNALQWDIIGVVSALGGEIGGPDIPLLPRLAVVLLASATSFVFITLRGAAIAAAVVAVAGVTRSIFVPGGIESPAVLLLAGAWLGIAATWLLAARVTTIFGWLPRLGLAAAGAALTVEAWWLTAVATRAETASFAVGTSAALPSLALFAIAAAVVLATLRFPAFAPGVVLVAGALTAASIAIGHPALMGTVSSVEGWPVDVWAVRFGQVTNLARSAAFDPALLVLVGVSVGLGATLGLRGRRPAPSGELLGAAPSRA